MVFLFLGLMVTQQGRTIKLSIVLREASAVLLPAEPISRSNTAQKDIDEHPLRAIAKVAATLIVVGAFALTAARWGWSVV
jgi:hypothetical protein